MKKQRFLILGLGSLALLSCGSDEDLSEPSQVECGPGTHLEGGKCVVDDGGAGGTGGSAGVGATGGSGGTSGSGATGGGATGGTSGGGGTAGSAGTAGSGGASGPGPDDDPCPAELDLDCSGQCGELSPDCDLGTCQYGASDIVVDDVAMLPYTFRTPSHPGIDPECAEWCDGPTATVYGLGVTFAHEFVSGKLLRAQVDLPWRIAMDGFMGGQYCEPNATECSIAYKSSEIAFHIITDDPNAPARNVTVDLVDKPGSCP